MPTRLNMDWVCSVVKDGMLAVREVMCVLSPWNDPQALTRAWCMWELCCVLNAQQVEQAELDQERKRRKKQKLRRQEQQQQFVRTGS